MRSSASCPAGFGLPDTTGRTSWLQLGHEAACQRGIEPVSEITGTRPAAGVGLLPQPHGFQGVAAAEEVAYLHDLSGADGGDLRQPFHSSGAAALPLPVDVEDDEDPLAVEIADLDHFSAQVVVEVVQVAPPPPDAVMPAKVTGLSLENLCDRRAVRDVRMARREKRFEIPATECRVHPPNNFHVLLRHRLLPQPGGLERPLSVTVILPVDKPAVTVCGDPCRRNVRLDAALPCSDMQRADREHPIPEVADVGADEPKDVKARRRVRDELTNPVMASVGPGYRRSQGLENHV